MQMKCHRCDRLFTPVGSEKHCPDCIAGKPIPKKRTAAEVRAEIKAKRDAGLIVVNISNNKREDARYIKRAKKRKDVKALNESEVINYLRIGCMKWVNR